MQKRSEETKEVKIRFRTKLKRTMLVLLCLLFAYSAIYAADISNKRMLSKEGDDHYALRASMEKGNMLRVDLAGTKNYYDVTNVKAFLNKSADKAQGLLTDVEKKFRNLLKSLKSGRTT